MRTGAGVAGIVGVAFLLSAGCGSDRPSGADAIEQALTDADAVDVCALLMAEEIEDTLAATPGEPEPLFYEDASLCVWHQADDVSVELVSVGLMDVTVDTYEQYLEDSETLLGFRATPEQAQQVEGPGHLAVWIPNGDGGTLHFFVDNHMFQVVTRPPPGRTALETSRALGEVIYQRLP